MEALQNENTLLKTYIATLEKENDARNQEKNTLFAEIDRLAAQNERLNVLLSKSQTKQTNNTTYGLSAVEKEDLNRLKSLNSSLTIQISGLKQQITALNSQIDSLRNNRSNEVTIVSNSQVENLKTVVTRLTANVREKQSQILRLSQQKQSMSKEIQQLKQQLSWSSKNGSQVSMLKGQIATYKSRISQLEMTEQHLKSYNLKLTQLQNQLRNIEVDLRKKQTDCKLLQSEVKRLEAQNRELRSNTRSPTQLSNLMSNKLSLQANLRQLNSKLEWSESARKVAQDEKVILERRIKQFEKESLQNKGKLTQHRFNQDSYRNVEASLHVKEKQMQALQQMINSLKQNKKYLEKTLKQKEDIVHSLEAQLYTFRSSNNEYERQRSEVNDLRLIRSDFERQVANLTRTIQQLQSQNNGLKQEIHSQNYTLIELRQERDNLIRRINASYQSNAQQKMRHAKDDDLRLIVQRLQAEVDEMRNSGSSKIYHVIEPNERMEFNQRSSVGMRDRSPTKGSHAKLVNQKEKQILHKSKWQNLQRKIIALRSQNQILKKSLF